MSQQSRRRWRRPSVGAAIGLFAVGSWLLMALVGPVVAPYDPSSQHLTERLLPPIWQAGGRAVFPLGTDELGRDMVSRLLHGARVALLIGSTVVLVAGTIGTIVGLVAGYYRGWIEIVAMRLIDVFLAFPFLLLALALLAVLGASLQNVILVLGITSWVPYARTVRAETLSLRRREFVEAARAIGARDRRIMARHLLPNLAAPLIVIATLEVATAVLAEASLTFIGLGIPPATPTWGQMLASGREYLFNAWWLSTLPGVSLFIVVLGVNLVGDWLRDSWDPRLRTA